MSSLRFDSSPTGSDAAVRYGRGKHFVHFTGLAARGPEIKQALPGLGWGTDAAGNLTLPLADVVRIGTPSMLELDAGRGSLVAS